MGYSSIPRLVFYLYSILLIQWIIFRIPSTETAAEKARDSLAKSLYDKIFGQIMQHINDHLSPSSYNNHSISILDIPGFGRFNIYSFHFIHENMIGK